MPDQRWKVVFQKTAHKEYTSLPKHVRAKVDETLEILSINPLSDILRLRKIRGKDNHYRVRVGDYRIIYSPQADTIIVRVIKIGHRKDIYRYY